ncbi:hypothetical protein ILYODFUR_029291 [Ilyodon furcidens]|uniref:Ig-like domain-containing protein n=1 Tax=Ilyodon furcidens TaxID=33524 RepID=A0ABV0TFJ8_9TELE
MLCQTSFGEFVNYFNDVCFCFSDSALITSKEGQNVILPCSFSTTLTNTIIDWKKDGEDVFLYENGRVNPSSQDEQFRGRVSHFPDEVKSGNASISIKQAKVSDSGTYTCLYLNQGQTLPSGTHQIILTVEFILKDRSGGKINGAFAKPLVSSHITGDWALLRCEVLGASPKPIVVWYDSDGNNVSDREPEVSEEGDCYNIILETKVTKTDNYTCVATQKELHHQSNKTTSVYIRGRSLEKSRMAVLSRAISLPRSLPESYTGHLEQDYNRGDCLFQSSLLRVCSQEQVEAERHTRS